MRDPDERGQDVDRENTDTARNGRASMTRPRAEKRAGKRENKPETAEGRAHDYPDRVEARPSRAHRVGGRDDHDDAVTDARDPAVRDEKPLVAHSKAQRLDERRGERVEFREEPDDQRG
ncbi:MAG TPA: hypothetical protein VFC53_03540 [Dehalococcoidia bacterium]|nr:hypothetical protein [Dehalococcoidia bacterium]